MIPGISKRVLIGGGVLSGTGFATGVSGLTIMGMNESETDLISKKLKIDDEKLKVQEEIRKLESEKTKLEQTKQNKEKIEKFAKDFEANLTTKINEIKENLQKNTGCNNLDLSKIFKSEDSLKNEDWYLALQAKYKGTAKYGKDCKYDQP